MPGFFLLAPGREGEGNVPEEGDDVGQGARGGDGFQEPKGGVPEDLSRVSGAPGESGDGARGELFDVLDVVFWGLGEEVEKTVTF